MSDTPGRVEVHAGIRQLVYHTETQEVVSVGWAASMHRVASQLPPGAARLLDELENLLREWEIEDIEANRSRVS